MLNKKGMPCKKCGGDLVNDYCRDETCAFSDWPQTVSYDDLCEMTSAQIEAGYGIRKRKPGDNTITIFGTGWWLRLGRNSVTSNLKSGETEHDAAVDGIESLVLAQHMAGLSVTSRPYIDALQTAIEACTNNL